MKKHVAWFAQARKDLLWGESSLQGGHMAKAFIDQVQAELVKE